MVSNTVVIAFIFRIINFLILIGLGVYFFKKYILVRIKQGIEEKKRKKLAFEQEQVKTQYAVQNLEQQLKNQQVEYAHLFERVTVWRNAVEHQQKQEHERNSVEEKTIAVRSEQKIEALKKRHYYQEVMPRAFARSREELETYFAHTEHQRAYLAHIFNVLGKNRG